jgi:putative membrane protein
VIFVWSLIRPFDLFSWFFGVSPAVAGVSVLVLSYKRFRFTNLVYLLIWVHAVILIVGGHYSYSRVPLFNWLRDTFEFSRNHYDRLGHFAQGFVPAMIAREILIRKSPVKAGKWLFLIVISFCLAISASWELYEWATAVVAGLSIDRVLNPQGDIWDTQWDMFWALAGAVISLVVLSRLHNRYLQKQVVAEDANPT